MRSFGVGTESERGSGSSRDEWRHRGAGAFMEISAVDSAQEQYLKKKRTKIYLNIEFRF